MKKINVILLLIVSFLYFTKKDNYVKKHNSSTKKSVILHKNENPRSPSSPSPQNSIEESQIGENPIEESSPYTTEEAEAILTDIITNGNSFSGKLEGLLNHFIENNIDYISLIEKISSTNPVDSNTVLSVVYLSIYLHEKKSCDMTFLDKYITYNEINEEPYHFEKRENYSFDFSQNEIEDYYEDYSEYSQEYEDDLEYHIDSCKKTEVYFLSERIAIKTICNNDCI